MISDADLLQANTTIIVGILIFLTIAPISKSMAAIIWERKAILGVISGTLIILIGSTTAVLFSDNIYVDSLLVSRILLIAGLMGIALTFGIILRSFPSVISEQKGQDNG